MFPVALKGMRSEALPSDIGSVLQLTGVGLLGMVALACLHAILYHLHYILAPFILSGFLVFALEPAVDRLYKALAGLAPPYRWCGCCMHRRWRSRRMQQGDAQSGNDSEASQEDSTDTDDRQASRILLSDQVGIDWEAYGIRILDGLCRFIAVVVVVAGIFLIALLIIYLLANGALNIRSHWPAYEKGMQNWVSWLDHGMDSMDARLKLSSAMDTQVKKVYTTVLAKLQDMILELVNSIASFVTGSVSFAVMVLLYMLFWLYQPLPIGGHASSLVQNYIWKKTMCAVLYGASVGTLLFCLGIDLPTFFGLVSFCLYFVPEVGAFLSMSSPIPLILLNGDIESPITWLIIALLGQVSLKLLIGNFLEMKLLSDDDEMSLHPVWVLLSLNYFGFLWGPVGMLISVPLLAAFKGIVIAKYEEYKERQPYLADFAGKVLACLEGRRRQGERRRSTLLPFSAPLLPVKKGLPEPTAEGQPRTADQSTSREEVSEESMALAATGPKKGRQQEYGATRESQTEEVGPVVCSAADLEEQKLAQPSA